MDLFRSLYIDGTTWHFSQFFSKIAIGFRIKDFQIPIYLYLFPVHLFVSHQGFEWDGMGQV